MQPRAFNTGSQPNQPAESLDCGQKDGIFLLETEVLRLEPEMVVLERSLLGLRCGKAPAITTDVLRYEKGKRAGATDYGEAALVLLIAATSIEAVPEAQKAAAKKRSRVEQTSVGPFPCTRWRAPRAEAPRAEPASWPSVCVYICASASCNFVQFDGCPVSRKKAIEPSSCRRQSHGHSDVSESHHDGRASELHMTNLGCSACLCPLDQLSTDPTTTTTATM